MGQQCWPVTIRAALGAALACMVAGWGGCALNLPTGDVTSVDGAASGTGGALGTSSGVDRTIHLMDLTFDQASALCDWENQKQGGYGRVVTCPGAGPESTSASPGGCVQKTLGLGGQCTGLMVGHIEDCVNATGIDLCKLETAPECAVILTCP